MPGWTDILGSFVSGLPQLAQAGASIYATSQQPKVIVQSPAMGAPQAFSPYYSVPSLVAGPVPTVTAASALPMLPSSVTRGAISGAMSAAKGAARALSARVAAYVGRRVTPAQAMALVRRVGPEAAAAALGLTVVELAQWMFASGAGRARRRRGITARQISNARSTIRRMTGFMASVQQACSPAMRGRGRSRSHRAGCGCVVCRR